MREPITKKDLRELIKSIGNEKLTDLYKNPKDIPPEFDKIVSDNFWDLIKENESGL